MRILIWIAIAVVFFFIGFKYAQNNSGPSPQPLIDSLKAQLQNINTQLQAPGLSANQTQALQGQKQSILTTLSSYFGYTIAQVETLLNIQ